MTYSTIYDMVTGYKITDGLQSQKVCDETIQTARRCAASRRHSVVVEDRGTQECYRVTRNGNIRPAPKDWVPAWTESD